MDIPIQIANGTSPVIVRADDPYSPLFYATLVLAIATFGLAIVVFLGNKKSNENTRESNNILKTEMRFRMKPLLVIEDNGSHRPTDVTLPTMLNVLIKNVGMASARKITIRIMPTNDTQIELLVKNVNENDQGLPIGTLPRNGCITFPRAVDMQGNFYIAIWFEYSYFEDEKDRSVVVFAIQVGERQIPPIWYDKEDIIEAQKKHKDFMDGKIGA
jgi:hypothetical protein